MITFYLRLKIHDMSKMSGKPSRGFGGVQGGPKPFEGILKSKWRIEVPKRLPAMGVPAISNIRPYLLSPYEIGNYSCTGLLLLRGM